MFEIIAREEIPTFENPDLVYATERIRVCASSIRRNFYRIANVLKWVDDKRAFVDDGFLSTIEYATKTFGIKKTLAYNLLSIGGVYTAENGVESNLPHDKAKDYTSSQMNVILPYDEADIREYAKNGDINPFMTVSALKKKLKELDGEESENEPEEPTEETAEEYPPEPEYLWNIDAWEDENGDVVIETRGDLPEVLANAINELLN